MQSDVGDTSSIPPSIPPSMTSSVMSEDLVGSAPATPAGEETDKKVILNDSVSQVSNFLFWKK